MTFRVAAKRVTRWRDRATANAPKRARTSRVSFHTIPLLWRAELDFMADFVFILLALGAGLARVTVQGRVSQKTKSLRVAKITVSVFPLSESHVSCVFAKGKLRERSARHAGTREVDCQYSYRSARVRGDGLLPHPHRAALPDPPPEIEPSRAEGD